jgi:hypothetical protein
MTDDYWIWSSCWNENWQGKLKYSKKTFSSTTITLNPIINSLRVFPYKDLDHQKASNATEKHNNRTHTSITRNVTELANPFFRCCGAKLDFMNRGLLTRLWGTCNLGISIQSECWVESRYGHEYLFTFCIVHCLTERGIVDLLFHY